MLRLYHGTTSVCAIKVRLSLIEKSLNWDSILLDLQKGDQYSSEYRLLNPNAVVPTLVHDDHVVVESTVILEYLEDAFPATPLMPSTPFSRASARLWMRKLDDYLHAACSTVTFAIAFRHSFLKLTPSALEQRLASIPNAAYRERQRLSIVHGLNAPHVVPALLQFDKYLDEMEAALDKSPYLAGPTYSLADLSATPYVNRAEMIGLSPLWSERRPNVTEWLSRVRERPSFGAAISDFFSQADVSRFSIDPDRVWSEVRAAMASA